MILRAHYGRLGCCILSCAASGRKEGWTREEDDINCSHCAAFFAVVCLWLAGFANCTFRTGNNCADGCDNAAAKHGTNDHRVTDHTASDHAAGAFPVVHTGGSCGGCDHLF